MCKWAIRGTSYQSLCSPRPSGSVIRSYGRMMDIAKFVTALTIHSVDSDDRLISTRRRQRDLQNGHRAAPQKPQWAVALWAGPLISIIDQQSGRPRNSRITGESVPRCAPLREGTAPDIPKARPKEPSHPSDSASGTPCTRTRLRRVR